jgi:hypothetical protein
LSRFSLLIRPSLFFAVVLLGLALGALALLVDGRQRAQAAHAASGHQDALVRDLGLSDLCLSTEARYTRHPAVTDGVAPFMDYPAALEHFPSGLFWAPQ